MTRVTRARMTLVLIAGLSLVAMTTTACRGGRGGKAEVTNTSTTVGQELQDLDAARAKGLVTEEEYKKQRKRILNQ